MKATLQHVSSVFRLCSRRIFARSADSNRFSLQPSAFSFSARPSRRRAFTAIELIGVLTVISLAAAALIPNVIRRIDRAAWEREKADLQAMADSYTSSILRNKAITNYLGIPTAVSKEMALSLGGIITTPRGWTRAFLVDPGFNVGGGKSFTQTTTGTGRPVSSRIMMISSLAGSLLVTNSDNNPDFQSIWDTPEGSRPAPWMSGPKGDDILIKKCNLEPLFYQIILIDHDGTGPRFSIDGSTPVAVAGGGLGWNSYYLDGSVLGLHDTNGLVQVRYLIKRNISFIFEWGAWRGGVEGGTSEDARAIDFLNHSISFLNQPLSPSGSANGATQFGVLLSMYNFMNTYTVWANECPHFDPHGGTGNSIPEYKMLNDQGQNASGNLDNFAGGLVK